MARKPLALMILFAALSVVFIRVICEAVPLPEVDAASEADKKPVVAPTPNGVDPSSPSVSGEAPSDIQTSTPTPTTIPH